MLLSIVIPVYQEEQAIPKLLAELVPSLDKLNLPCEIIFVNDGSRDGTCAVLARAAALDHRMRVVEFSRNFGHQAAVTAGLDVAAGDAVVVMDADLQDPPELLAELVALYRQGYDVVSPQRRLRDGETWFKRATAAAFYWLMKTGVDSRVTPQVGDFRLYSQRAVVALRKFREEHRFLRGMVAWLGLKEVVVPFHRARRIAGETNYPLWKMLGFAWTAISSSSAAPLRLTALAGLLLSATGAFYLAYILYVALVTQTTVPGWSSLVSLQFLFSGTILLAIGLVGDYLSRVYDEAKERPLYVVAQSHNVDPPPTCARAVWLTPRPSDIEIATVKKGNFTRLVEGQIAKACDHLVNRVD